MFGPRTNFFEIALSGDESSGEVILIQVKEKTALETCLLLDDIDSFDPVAFIYDLCMNCSVTDLGHEDKKRVATEASLAADEIIRPLLYLAYGVSQEEKQRVRSAKEVDDPQPIRNYIVAVAEQIKTDPLQLLNTYSWRGLRELGEALVWNANMTTDEGRKKNRQKAAEIKFALSKDSIADTMKKAEEILARAHSQK